MPTIKGEKEGSLKLPGKGSATRGNLALAGGENERGEKPFHKGKRKKRSPHLKKKESRTARRGGRREKQGVPSDGLRERGKGLSFGAKGEKFWDTASLPEREREGDPESR